MKYRVWLSFSNPTDPGSVAVRRLLQTLTGIPVVDFLPIQEKCVGTIELASPPDWTDDQIMAVLRPLSPNAVGVRFEPMADVAVMTWKEMMEAVELIKMRHDIVSVNHPVITPEMPLPSGQGTPEYDATAPLLDTLKSVPQVFQATCDPFTEQPTDVRVEEGSP